MKYFFCLYLANMSGRFRRIAQFLVRLCWLVLALAYLSLAQNIRPLYYNLVASAINWTWLIMLAGMVLILLPSEKYILNVLAIYRRDHFMRDSIIARLLRLIKYIIKHDWLKLKYKRGLYQRLITKKRLKWFCFGLYFYDLMRAYRQVVVDGTYFIVVYFGFICASWLYVKYSGVNLYYYSIILSSLHWGLAIIGFLIFKVLFLPDFTMLKNSLIKLTISIAWHKFGLARINQQLAQKLERYDTSVPQEQSNA